MALLTLGAAVFLLVWLFGRRVPSSPLTGPPPVPHIRDVWTLEGGVDRGPYLAWGFGLMALKYNLERLAAGALFHRPWSVLAHYLHSPELDPRTYNGADRDFYAFMVLMSLPFIWTGVALTVRRLRSAGLPRGLAALFFVPFVNLLFFLLMSALPAVGELDDSPRLVDRLIPRSEKGGAALVVVGGGALVLLLARFSTSFFEGYGWGLFVGLPFVLGLFSSMVYGHHKGRTLRECLSVAALSVGFACVVLFAAALEGIVCIVMAAPLAVILSAMGAVLGYFIQRGPRPKGHGPALLALLLGLPVLMGAESVEGARDAALPLSTTVDVAAPPETVWQNVVSFSALPAPKHWIFKLGFAYPLRATIAGRGPGAVRRCEFSTGAFVEPITVWDEPRRLRFSVASQPPPMRESSWYPDLRPAHLDGFLVSEGGQFELAALPGGGTRLTGTTWYRHEIRPSWYWRPWSDWIIHRIHERVLAHVKGLSERDQARTSPPGKT